MRISTRRCYAIVPAAGSGSRMRSEQPKQYLPLLGQPLIRHTLAALCASPVIDRVYVVLSVGDQEWDRHDWSPFGERLVPLFCGGASRADSVLNGLRAIADEASESDWVLVHDAARPCLAPWHIETLVRELSSDEVGGILAVPVADTLKREDSTHRIADTVPREGLWQAQTPQMFRYVMLKRALESARNVNDEASAIEAMGLRPRLVRGDPTNLKVTYPLDLHLAEWILQHREGDE
ncbi:2-C-methyl-D-erythritol 4-phosphate cytidylyltransferase [Zoogloea sp.]|uniref:2-C-methyl-D-erythritol 4-phosphate cytidylyltransferase n=1 Tax=Zoogloea sp. TaxID=49181 RepID=UPI0026103198|nr:2-C-methyl-D-erythritol 4-phosphate cytidylyltransferase [Zoogloea sp.]